MIKLKIILASTRTGRKGPSVAAWILDYCKKRKEVEVELIDLAEVNLPFLDEPNSPSQKKYTKEHTKKWSKRIDAADAFIFVTAEYNYGYPAPLKNALDFLYQEWNYKPVAFVSYGGVAGGTRAVQQLKQVVTAQKMLPVNASVNIPFFTKYITEDGVFEADEGFVKAAGTMMDELLQWNEAAVQLQKK